MNALIDMAWAGSEHRPDQVPLVRVSWSYPLSQAGLAPGRFAELDQILKSATDASFSAAMAEQSLEGLNVGWDSDVRQIGTNAEDVHAAIGFLTDVGWDMLVTIGANWGIHLLSRVVETMHKRLAGIREQAGAHEIATRVDLHPDVLVQLCVERVSDWTASSVISSEWSELTDGNGIKQRTSDHHALFRVVIRTLTHEYPFIISEFGAITHEEGDVPESDRRLDAIKWPSQDHVDRSSSIAIVAILRPDLLGGTHNDSFMRLAADLATEVQARLGEATREALNEFLPGTDVSELRARHYQVGPAAGGMIGLEHSIISLLASPEMTAVLSFAQIVGICASVYRQMKAWIATKNDPRLDVAISYPPRVLEMSCQEWIRQHRHPQANLESDWFCLTENFYDGYVSPAHPSESLEYVITVRSPRNIYEFTIRGTGDVEKLIRIKNGKRTEIEVGNIFAEEDSHATD